MGEDLFEVVKARYEETKDFIKGNKLWLPIAYPAIASAVLALVILILSIILIVSTVLTMGSYLLDFGYGGIVIVLLLTPLIIAGSVAGSLVIPNCTFKSYVQLSNSGEKISFKESIKLGFKGCVGFFCRNLIHVLLPTILLSLLGLVLMIIPFFGFILNGLLLGIASCCLICRFYARELGINTKGIIKHTVSLWLPVGVIYGTSIVIPMLALAGVVVLYFGEFHFIYHLTKENQKVLLAE